MKQKIKQETNQVISQEVTGDGNVVIAQTSNMTQINHGGTNFQSVITGGTVHIGDTIIVTKKTEEVGE